MKILLTLAASLLIFATSAQRTLLCSSDQDCIAANSGLCVRSLCMSSEQLRFLAETYAPKEALLKVHQQFASPQCSTAADCDEQFDRCSRGACFVNADVAQYQTEASETYVRHFGGQSEQLPKMSRNCVTDSQCIPGDLCIEGACMDFFMGEQKI